MQTDCQRYLKDQLNKEAFFALSRKEGIIPAIESAHPLAVAMRMAKEENNPGFVLVNLSGRSDKELDHVIEHYGDRH